MSAKHVQHLPLRSLAAAVRKMNPPATGESVPAANSAGTEPAAQFEVVFSTGAAVRRRDWERGRDYVETLEVTDRAVNLERLQRGVPLLNSHSAWDLEDQIGVVENPKIANGRGTATATLSRRANVAGVVQDLRDGILRSVSVGYTRDRVEMIPPTDAQPLWEYRVTRWTPHEVSLVAIAADAGAQVTGARAEHATKSREFPCQFFTRNTTMTDTTIDIDQRALIERGAAAERTRIADIQKRCKLGKMDAAFTQQLIDDGVSGDAIGARILDVIVDRQEAIQTRTQSSISTHGLDDDHRSSDGRDDLSEGIVGTLMRRLGVRAAKPHPATRDFQDMPLPQMMRMHLAASRGSRMSTLLQQSNHEIVSQAMSTRGGLHTTSDFPGLLGSAVNRALRQLQEAEVPSFRAWTKAGLGRDFKTMERLALGSAPALEKVNEGGEYEFGSFAEDKATFALAKYGKIFAISYEALTNDDLGAFDGVPAAMIRTANRLGSKLVYDSFGLNSGAGPTMPDGLALFHATHANLQGTAVAFDSAALSTARVLLRKQQANKEGYLGLEPKFLIVGPERETVAETLLSAGALIKTATGEAPNPSWISRLTLVVDPRINANSMYLLASPAQIDTYEFAELEGENGPVVETKTDFEVDQFALKVRYVCGGAWVDFRGAVKVSLI